MTRSREAGFMLVEAVIAIALIALCAGTVMTAVVTVQHQTTTELPAAGLTLSAQNILTDLRAATAYDAQQLADLPGRSTSFEVSESAQNGTRQTLHVVITVDRSETNGTVVAAVTVRNARGQTATVQSALVQEAPAPGSTINADAPAPDASY